MSSHYYLYCERTGECAEAVAHVGSTSGPRIEANALQAFLVYHHLHATGTPLVLRDIDSIDGDDRSVFSSLDDVAQEFESIGSFAGYQSPILIWTEENYRALAGRDVGLAAKLEEYENAPSGGVWVRRTVDGRII